MTAVVILGKKMSTGVFAQQIFYLCFNTRPIETSGGSLELRFCYCRKFWPIAMPPSVTDFCVQALTPMRVQKTLFSGDGYVPEDFSVRKARIDKHTISIEDKSVMAVMVKAICFSSANMLRIPRCYLLTRSRS